LSENPKTKSYSSSSTLPYSTSLHPAVLNQKWHLVSYGIQLEEHFELIAALIVSPLKYILFHRPNGNEDVFIDEVEGFHVTNMVRRGFQFSDLKDC
ncbi:hypothetical protein C5167_001367, partial [Papaver somniferum]